MWYRSLNHKRRPSWKFLPEHAPGGLSEWTSICLRNVIAARNTMPARKHSLQGSDIGDWGDAWVGKCHLSCEKLMLAISYEVDLSDLGEFVFKIYKITINDKYSHLYNGLLFIECTRNGHQP
jgi:hypothetical protein